MKKWILIVWLSRLLAAESRLDQLLAQQRQEYSQAVITSGFHEPRGVSRYRSRPGVHSGYDIAMPAGSKARAAWPGRVEAIIPWADGEWGVQVLHSDGTRATYGHIVPLVSSGQELQPGQAVGLIARDHLDVKMRDGRGVLYDYGGTLARYHNQPLAPILPGPQALAWQRRWRSFSQQPPNWLSRAQREQLSSQGLSTAAGPAGSDLEELKAEYLRLPARERARLSWNERDRQESKNWAERHKNEQQLLELGLVAANRVRKLRIISDLWREVLQPGARTVAVDELATGGRRTGHSGFPAEEAANGRI